MLSVLLSNCILTGFKKISIKLNRGMVALFLSWFYYRISASVVYDARCVI